MADRSEIDEIRTRMDIVSVVEQHVTLKRQGRVYKGLCPFHQEKTPSFQVNPDMGTWHCFGQCSEGGDVFKFVQKIDNLSFAEALERLALRTGVTLTRMSRSGDSGAAQAQTGERERIYRVNAVALSFFMEQLAHSPVALDYLQRRKLDSSARQQFFVGFAPDEWEGLVGYLTRQRVPLADAEAAGLVVRNDRGGYRDRMRNRVIFPILDVQERPIAFGGRIIEAPKPGEPPQPKYWNSPETPVFSKSRTLYGLWRARKAISDTGQSIVVEGYTDVVAAHQAGFTNVVATLGTALTDEHVKVLARLAPKVLLSFDADSAGLSAAYRAAEIFEAREVQVYVLDLPVGEDPDSLLSKGRRDVFARCIENAIPLTEYRILSLIRKSDVDTEQGRSELFRKALPILAQVTTSVERERHIGQLARYHPRFSAGSAIAEAQIRQDAAEYRTRAGATPSSVVRPDNKTSRTPGGRPLEAKDTAERQLLRAMISGDSELSARVFENIRPEEFLTPLAQKLAIRLYEIYAATGTLDPAKVLPAVDDDAQLDLLTSLSADDVATLSVEMLDDDITRLRTLATARELALLKDKLDSGDMNQAVVQEFQRLHRLQTVLKAKKFGHRSVGE